MENLSSIKAHGRAFLIKGPLWGRSIIHQCIPLMKCQWCGALKLSLLLTHWGQVTHICISKSTIIGSDNGLLPGWRRAIIWTTAGILFIGPSAINFSEILTKIHTFSFKKMHLKMSSRKCHSLCFSLNVLTSNQHWKERYLQCWFYAFAQPMRDAVTK